MATLDEMTTFVRLQADTDENDAPNLLMAAYAKAAYRDIQSRVFPWPDKKTAYGFETVPGQTVYPYALIPIPDLQFVISVSSATQVFQYVSAEEMLKLSVGTGSGAMAYTADSTGITLWPVPTSSMSVSVSGYRKFVAWPLEQAGSTVEPDLPAQFNSAIPWFMLSKFYESQEDLELAARYMQQYEIAVDRSLGMALRTSSVTAGPRIFGNQSLDSGPFRTTGLPYTTIQGA